MPPALALPLRCAVWFDRAAAWPRRWLRRLPGLMAPAFAALMLAACGNDDDGGGPVAPTITEQPEAATIVVGQTATFDVAASGSGPLSYQWRRNGVDIAGATGSSITTGVAVAGDNGALYSVVVANAGGTVTSNAATLTVGAAIAPTVTTPPASASVVAGQTATFSVVASGSAPLAYAWRRDGSPIAGATSASYTTAATTLADDGARYSVRVHNAGGEAISDAAILSVTAAPVAPSIATQPQAATVTVGQTASFSVVAAGSAPLAYQWRRNGTAIAGATGASYTTPATVAGDDGAKFSVVVGNGTAPDATSADALLTVTAAVVAPAITTQPASVTVNPGQSASFSVAASGTAPLAYQWRKNGTDIGGATQASYTTPAAVAADHGAKFAVVVSNSAGSVTSSDATLSLGTPSGAAMAELFRSRNCLACHAAESKLVGPTWRAIADRFGGRADQEDYLVQRIRQGGSGAWGAVPMPPSPNVTAEEATQMARWFIAGAP